jgi:hypothetical protein
MVHAILINGCLLTTTKTKDEALLDWVWVFVNKVKEVGKKHFFFSFKILVGFEFH